MSEGRTFEEILSAAISIATKQIDPDSAFVVAEQTKNESGKYDSPVQTMAALATDASLNRIKAKMNAVGVRCAISRGFPDVSLAYDTSVAENPQRAAIIKYSVDFEGGITVTASKDQHKQNAYVEIAKFSPSETTKMVVENDADAIQTKDPQDHPLMRALRDALAYTTRL